MAILDPIKRVRAVVQTNIIGTISGGALGYYFVRKRLPIQGKWGVAISVIGGALVGAYVSKYLVAKKGALASANQAKK